MPDAVYDIETNKFIKRPEDFVFDKNLYIKDFDKKVQELDVIKGELKEDIIDYRELEELEPNDVLDLQDKVKDKLEEIEDSIEQIIKVGGGVDADRSTHLIQICHQMKYKSLVLRIDYLKMLSTKC